MSTMIEADVRIKGKLDEAWKLGFYLEVLSEVPFGSPTCQRVCRNKSLGKPTNTA